MRRVVGIVALVGLAACSSSSGTSAAPRRSTTTTSTSTTTTTTLPFVPSADTCHGIIPDVDNSVACTVWLGDQTRASVDAEYATFDQIQIGMSLDQVRAITGPGTMESTASVGGQSSEVWGFPHVLVSFLNGRVAAKARA